MNQPRVLIVVATLGRRPEFLRQTLDSIRSQEVASDVVMVAPLDSATVQEASREYGVPVLADPGSLPGAINLGARELKDHHEYFNWLNDDDLLEPGSLKSTVAALDQHPHAVVAFGSCRYIDPAGRQLWISKAGKWAPRVLSWGPDLIPQPGMLVRSSAWNEVKGLDESYRLAFDLDLLLKLKKLGPFIQVPAVVSAFRWHPDSLTVDDRTTNIKESERAKRASLSPTVRRFTWIWEAPVRVATRMAANEVQRRAQRLSAE
jgi:GT2 family glycosyltransferase